MKIKAGVLLSQLDMFNFSPKIALGMLINVRYAYIKTCTSFRKDLIKGQHIQFNANIFVAY